MSGVLKTGLMIMAVVTVQPLAAEVSYPVVPSFDGPARTMQGGMFCCFGGSPMEITDRVCPAGHPERIAWKIETTPWAAHSVGGFIPLFDDRLVVDGKGPLDVSSAPVLQMELCGFLGDRQLVVEIQEGHGAKPWKRGVKAGVVDASELKRSGWNTFSWKMPSGVNVSRLGGIRLVLEGEGAAELAVASVGFVQGGESLAVRTQPKRAKHSMRKAMWVWNTATIAPDAAAVEKLLGTCKRNGITDIYVQIPYDRDGEKVDLRMPEQLRRMNEAAHKAGITIHALDGDPAFVLRKNHAKVYAWLDVLEEYQKSSTPTQRYDAIHLDNEPFVLKEWKEGRRKQTEILDQYIELTGEVSKRVRKMGLAMGADIPFWWDNLENGKPMFQVTTADGLKPVLDVLFPLLDNVGIMSYRERVTGTNGVIGVCRHEFDLSQKYGTDVLASVELFTEVEKGITFGIYPKRYFESQMETLERTLSYEPGCAGIAIHFYGPLSEMEKKP